MSDSKKIIRKWIDAFTKKDLEAVMDCYADDAVNFQVAAGEPAVGKEQIRKDTAEFFKGFPDSYSVVENIIADEDWAAWEWNGGGTFGDEFYGNQPTGKSYQLRGCGFFQFKDGKIIFQRGYWDKLTWFSQVGIKIEK
ncbi:MAG: nuclear transport factor 2 family protein [Acidobacteriota bacterium]|nr:nuclear transport factor 2 family protein [Acidobacteriota bacterium]